MQNSIKLKYVCIINIKNLEGLLQLDLNIQLNHFDKAMRNYQEIELNL